MPRKIKTFDIALYVIPIIFVTASVAVIYSLVFGTNQTNIALRQGLNAVIGLGMMVSVGFIDYRLFKWTSWVAYFVSMVLLAEVDFLGKTVNGAQNWLNFGLFQLQPSEITKACLIFVLAAFFSHRIGKLKSGDIFLSILIVLPQLGLIIKEPDLGTALVIGFVYLVMLFAAKPTKKQSVFVLGLISVVMAMFLFSAYRIAPFTNLLHDYQRNRIITFISPGSDPLGSGYNVRQAQISVGSGKFLGKGLGRGSQSQLQFLPEPHNDFIFAGISESFGFIGSSIFLLLYLYLILKIINIANTAQDNFGMLICFGVAAILMFQVTINVGMNLGVAPVTGIPLPLLSAGGTALIVTLFLIGLVQSVFIHHKKISF